MSPIWPKELARFMMVTGVSRVNGRALDMNQLPAGIHGEWIHIYGICNQSVFLPHHLTFVP